VDYNEQLKDDITKRVHERINARMQRRMERRQRYGHGAGGMVIGGLIVATVTTLVFVPCVFAIVHGGGKGRPQAQTRSPA